MGRPHRPRPLVRAHARPARLGGDLPRAPQRALVGARPHEAEAAGPGPLPRRGVRPGHRDARPQARGAPGPHEGRLGGADGLGLPGQGGQDEGQPRAIAHAGGAAQAGPRGQRDRDEGEDQGNPRHGARGGHGGQPPPAEEGHHREGQEREPRPAPRAPRPRPREPSGPVAHGEAVGADAQAVACPQEAPVGAQTAPRPEPRADQRGPGPGRGRDAQAAPLGLHVGVLTGHVGRPQRNGAGAPHHARGDDDPDVGSGSARQVAGGAERVPGVRGVGALSGHATRVAPPRTAAPHGTPGLWTAPGACAGLWTTRRRSSWACGVRQLRHE